MSTCEVESCHKIHSYLLWCLGETGFIRTNWVKLTIGQYSSQRQKIESKFEAREDEKKVWNKRTKKWKRQKYLGTSAFQIIGQKTQSLLFLWFLEISLSSIWLQRQSRFIVCRRLGLQFDKMTASVKLCFTVHCKLAPWSFLKIGPTLRKHV